MYAYGTNDLVGLVGVSTARIRSWVRAGYLRPSKGSRGELRFSFHDLILVRTAKALGATSFSARQINRSLKNLRQALPPELPLTGLCITAVGAQIAVREGGHQREIDSGQYVLALDVQSEAGQLRFIDRTSTPSLPNSSASAHYFDAAGALEDSDPDAAIAAYERCLEADAEHMEALINCGRLLHVAGRLAAAENLYRRARTENATLLFNLGVLLEDLDRHGEAMTSYRQALEIDPRFADAHFNLARLHERVGEHQATLRHLVAYKRLLG